MPMRVTCISIDFGDDIKKENISQQWVTYHSKGEIRADGWTNVQTEKPLTEKQKGN